MRQLFSARLESAEKEMVKEYRENLIKAISTARQNSFARRLKVGYTEENRAGR